MHWDPPRRFDFVRAALGFVPRRRQRELLHRLLHEVVAPRGRLIFGTRNEERGEPPGRDLVERLRSWGFELAGSSERPHYNDERLAYRVLWLDAG